MALTNAAKEAAADAVVALGDRISLHTADPGATGANEQSGGSGARKTTVWATGDASDGINTGSEVTIDAPAGTYTHFGVWSSTGTFIGGNALGGGPVTLSATGQVKVTPTYTQS